jgi:putative ABC transport system permease protein
MVSVHAVVEAMKAEMTRQLDELGANIIIKPDSGGLTFSYGGIVIPEVLFDVEKLTMADVASVREIPLSTMVRAVSPKLLGVLPHAGHHLIVSGSDLKSEFATKPWLRLHSERFADTAEKNETAGGGKDKFFGRLDLTREELNRLNIADDEVLLGAAVAKMLDKYEGDSITLDGREFRVFAVLEENGSPEDNQVFVRLAVAQDLLGRPDEVTLIEVSADYSLGPEEALLSQLNSALPHAEVTSLRQAVLGRDEMLSRLTRFGVSVSVLVLLVGMLVVVLTMSAAVRERTREIGIFRAIGFRQSHIVGIVLMEGAVLSLVGGIVGYLAGMSAARLAGPVLADMPLSTPWRADLLIAAVLVATATGLGASVFPARQAAGLDPAEALRFI